MKARNTGRYSFTYPFSSYRLNQLRLFPLLFMNCRRFSSYKGQLRESPGVFWSRTYLIIFLPRWLKQVTSCVQPRNQYRGQKKKKRNPCTRRYSPKIGSTCLNIPYPRRDCEHERGPPPPIWAGGCWFLGKSWSRKGFSQKPEDGLFKWNDGTLCELKHSR